MLQGVRLDEAYSLSALQLALDELPHAWAQQARRDPKGLFIKVCCHCDSSRQLAHCLVTLK
jgi:hypothetical protein